MAPRYALFFFAVVFGAVGLSAGGCASDQANAQRAVQAEMRQRRADQLRARQHYQAGMRAYEKGDLERARTALDAAVAVDDRNVSAWMALGVVAHEQNQLFDAASAFGSAAKLAPSRYEPHFNLGAIHESVGRYGHAIEAYETALQLAPENVEVMENLARCYLRTNQRKGEAKRLIEAALQREQRPEWRHWLQMQALKLADTVPDSQTTEAR